MQVTVPIVGALIAGIYDALTGEIPEAITVPLIVTGIIRTVLLGDFIAILVAVLTSVLGYLLYYTGQLGGGDVLLLTGISLWIPLLMGLPSALLIFVIATLLCGVFYGIKYCLRINKFLVVPLFFTPPAISVVYGVLLSYISGSKKDIFIAEKPIEELKPEDILAEDIDVLPKGKRVVERGDIEVLRNAGIKKVKVLENLPRLGFFIFVALLFLLLLETHALDLHEILFSLFFNTEIHT